MEEEIDIKYESLEVPETSAADNSLQEIQRIVENVPDTIGNPSTTNNQVVRRKIDCNLCYKTFKIAAFGAHYKTVHNQTYFPCHLCDYGSDQNKQLKRHLESIHGETDLFRCDRCRASFVRACMREEHVKRVHSKREREYICCLCMREYRYEINLRRHVDKGFCSS
jgi:hypothetical protein